MMFHAETCYNDVTMVLHHPYMTPMLHQTPGTDFTEVIISFSRQLFNFKNKLVLLSIWEHVVAAPDGG